MTIGKMMPLRHLCTVLMIAATAPVAVANDAACPISVPEDHVFSPDQQNSYDVYRNGKNIGTHIISAQTLGPLNIVEAQTKLRVKIAFVTAYKNDYRAREIWCGGKLMSVTSESDDNGTIITSSITRETNGFKISGTKNGEAFTQPDAPLQALPTSHWNKNVLSAPARINTILGKTFPITVTPRKASDNQEGFKGMRYDITGGGYDYATYYGADDIWQGMAFQRGNKGFLEFKCKSCDTVIKPSIGFNGDNTVNGKDEPPNRATTPARTFTDHPHHVQSGGDQAGGDQAGGDQAAEPAATRPSHNNTNNDKPLFALLLGKDFTGALTYLDYGSQKPVTIPVDAAILSADATGFSYRIIYPKEPQHNATQNLKFTNDETRFDGHPVISRETLKDGTVKISTEYKGEDNGKPARIRMHYTLSSTVISIRKNILFDGSETEFERSRYALSR